MSRFGESVRDGVLVLRITPEPGRVPLLTRPLLAELDAQLTRLSADDGLVGAVIAGPAGGLPGRPDAAPAGTFAAGADVRAFLDFGEADEARAEITEGQALLTRVERSAKPVVAAVHGACMGGGLELALACRAVLASTASATRFGLPEVRLGLTPGLGGTQRLPRRVGPSAALGIALTGRSVYVREARRLGLVDATVHPEGLVEAAARAVRELAAGRWRPTPPRRTPATRLLDGPLGRGLVWRQAARRARAEGGGHYPAPERILHAVRTGIERGPAAGYAAEAEAFAELLFTPEARALIHLFFARAEARRNPRAAEAREVGRLAVVGGGFMGGGIAQVSAQGGFEVRVKDRDLALAAQARRTVHRGVTARVGKGVTPFERDATVDRVAPVADYADLGAVDLTIEAVPEVLELKREVRAAVEAVTGPGHVYASNTSAIAIGRIAEGSARPEAVLGMHYFSPVPRMPLLEVIRGEATADWAVGTAVATGLRQGKVVIVVDDGPGFYANRVLARYTAEAFQLIREGADITLVDELMRDYGFALGPFAVLDDVGLDVAAEVQGLLEGTEAARGAVPDDTLARLVGHGFLGRKAGKGFYRYRGGRRGREVDRSVYVAAGLGARRRVDAERARERLALAFLNEAVRCLDGGVLRTPVDGDVGAVFGLGFPPFRGGPFFEADRLGAADLVARLRRLEHDHGERFEPAEGLVRRAERGEPFHRTPA